ncbi:hypothetical protein COCVIDRAFT_33875 [Bipolaris victoriae FI3]|uniref:Uncharacterized protein n=2 Tax=Bipolaris TaxID=33194 RepID=W6Y3K2_COCC2|nr:uncharacterized protein COCCADRAFT_37814 [Bipolaris zeicola 26-R-13]XP_014561176.1 hypothetical protein COCVIDRAFT_33875 [Bipolaris victoriae FI3]EUC32220.1 hypothetical protein COCCADRAFT_37814 [Bipolaris zeicola 26-R-13]
MKLISATLAFLFGAAPTLAAVGGRCSNNWGDDCICLDHNVCRTRWGGIAYTGYPGNWPCPNDPDNIMACVIPDCPGHGSGTQCLWREGCRSLNGDRVCPGGNDFVCCNHNYLGG